MIISSGNRGREARTGKRRVAALAALSLGVLALTACNAEGGGDDPGEKAKAADGSPSATTEPVDVSSNIRQGAKNVPVNKIVSVTADGGTLQKVVVTAPKQPKVTGQLSADKTTWKSADQALEPGASYTVKTTALNEDGTQQRSTSRFTTEALTLDQQTYPSVAPLQGETVGVGMPVIVNFDLPVTDKATFEKHMHVTSQPQQAGSWYWISDNEAHWRPKSYWQPGTKVDVDVDVNSLPAGNGIYGQEKRKVSFQVGDKHVYKVNIATHQMKVFSNGKLLRTLPITTGKDGFTTRSGVKVIMEKFPSKRMNSETIGIDPDSSEGYDLDNVQWAMRVTSSGEFIHAAPWSTGSQGAANVSHGCTGLSTANAKWLYDMTLRGDVTEYTGSDRPMTMTNGYGDWNVSYADYRDGSALS